MSSPRYSSLNEWLDWMETLHPVGIDLGLERISTVAERLGLHKKSKVITVAGTNGKGSCVAVLEQLLLSQGISVGAYTSPHLLHYNERVRIDGASVSDQKLCEAFARIDAARQDISLTYFEFGTLAALLIFSDEPLAYWLLEVGLGGRLDAVNILPPDIAVVTSIALDHEAWLGNTREKIAVEKLGILRDGTPCVCAESDPTSNMLDIFAKLQTPCYLVDRDFHIHDSGPDKVSISGAVSLGSNVESWSVDITKPALPLPSVAAALQVAAIEGFLPESSSAAIALEGTGLAGRFETIQHQGRDIVLDVAHNPAAAALLAKNISHYADSRPVLAVVGMMHDKDIEGVLSPLCSLISAWWVGEFEDDPRSAKNNDVAEVLQSAGVATDRLCLVQNVPVGLDKALEAASSYDEAVILVFGSFVTVSLAKAFLLA